MVQGKIKVSRIRISNLLQPTGSKVGLFVGNHRIFSRA